MIRFNKAPVLGTELQYISDAISSQKLCGDGVFCKKSEKLLEDLTGCEKALLTPSCTAALELAALLIDLKEGDEVIVPSYTFVSTANAFVLRGAKIIFVDVQKDTMNIDPVCIAAAVTERTKVIVPVHYAGVACDMDAIMSIANEHNLFVVEDAAQAIGSAYKGKQLGSIGHFGAFSFHETKNVTSGGEGGALIVNDKRFVERSEIIREKGTNRSKFFRGNVDKYSWVDIGSSFLPSEIQAAYLYGQLLELERINTDRLVTWNYYQNYLEELENKGLIELPSIPEFATNNAHMFYFKCQALDVRTELLNYLKEREVSAVFHYVPLHTASAGLEFGEFCGDDTYTTNESEKLIRLPLYFGMERGDVELVSKYIKDFYAL
ncbi:dTDP-4-amino-4,6-dideoxygalactose transaminase [Vibrio sp. 10N.222.54.F12]|uniref:dTDP-4-amino-4,6-dideoxygalactose transaminase n=1 Tax=Vibrio TaxID=662 RepID=UPI000C82D56C|nr:dTDP-4-amino-4,6-dideoxygalactose transaminase [Vibrio tasmaniensis]PML18549.1 dTDP-4-amino-4,6-dideoxygalactose transaminase [Vibrio tasmaniensis]PML49379.1 dTDP-4-amino-4,6-dideoxygalactose transaminase [Vibrio tasmaniensis]